VSTVLAVSVAVAVVFAVAVAVVLLLPLPLFLPLLFFLSFPSGESASVAAVSFPKSLRL